MRFKPIPEHALLDYLKTRYGLTTDVQLAALLDVTTPCLSKVRHNVNPVSADLMIKMHEVTGMSTKELKKYLVDHG